MLLSVFDRIGAVGTRQSSPEQLGRCAASPADAAAAAAGAGKQPAAAPKASKAEEGDGEEAGVGWSGWQATVVTEEPDTAQAADGGVQLGVAAATEGGAPAEGEDEDAVAEAAAPEAEEETEEELMARCVVPDLAMSTESNCRFEVRLKCALQAGC